MLIRFLAVLLSSVAAVASANASSAPIDAGAAISAARKACWELSKPVPSIWRLRIASGRFDAQLESKLWHIRLIESSFAPKCPVVDATVTIDGSTVTCTLRPHPEPSWHTDEPGLARTHPFVGIHNVSPPFPVIVLKPGLARSRLGPSAVVLL
jgi:hypothetical protein